MKISVISIILFVFIISISCVTANDIVTDNNLNDSNNIFHDPIGVDITPINPNLFSMINRLNKISDKLISAKNITNSLLIEYNNINTTSSNQINNKSIVDPKLNINNSTVINSIYNTSNLINNGIDKNNKSDVLFNDTLLNHSQFNKTFKGFGLTNNLSDLINKTRSNLSAIGITNKSIINNTNVYHNTSDLVNSINGKNNKSNGLFNNTSHKHEQFNNSLKLVGLNKFNPDNIGKELNNLKLNNNISNGFSEDNFISYVPEPKQNYNNYIMLLIPILLVLLGVIYYIKKR